MARNFGSPCTLTRIWSGRFVLCSPGGGGGGMHKKRRAMAAG